MADDTDIWRRGPAGWATVPKQTKTSDVGSTVRRHWRELEVAMNESEFWSWQPFWLRPRLHAMRPAVSNPFLLSCFLVQCLTFSFYCSTELWSADAIVGA